MARHTTSKLSGDSSPAGQKVGYQDRKLAKHWSGQPAKQLAESRCFPCTLFSLSLSRHLTAQGEKIANRLVGSAPHGRRRAGMQAGSRPVHQSSIPGLGSRPASPPSRPRPCQPNWQPTSQTNNEPPGQRTTRESACQKPTVQVMTLSLSPSPSLSLYRTLLSLSELVWGIRRGCKADKTWA